MTYQEVYQRKMAYLKEEIGNGYTTIPVVAKKILHIDEGRLRADPTFPVIFVGKRRRVPIDSLARWLTDKEVKQQ